MIESFGHVIDVWRYFSLVLFGPPATADFSGENAQEYGQVEKRQLFLLKLLKIVKKFKNY